VNSSIPTVYESLQAAYGPQGWWPISGKYFPGDYSRPRDDAEAFEVCVGALLAQNTAWKNAEKAVASLASVNALNPQKITVLEQGVLAQLIRSSGYYNQKALRLKLFSDFVVCEGGLEKLFALPLPELRAKLLALNGVGEETADSIILYAAKKPSFVVDAYTKRIAFRLGLLPEDESYAQTKELFEASLPSDYAAYNECHALLVEHAKRHCTKKAPRCSDCPLQRNCNYTKTRLATKP